MFSHFYQKNIIEKPKIIFVILLLCISSFGFFAKETGQGIAFGSDDRSNFSDEKGKGTKVGREKSTKRNRLQLVK